MRNTLKILSLAFVLFYSNFLFSQTFDAQGLKEDFDTYNDYLVYQKHRVCTINPNEDAFVFGDGMSKILEAYLNLYDATKDKAYLYKFISQSLCIIENRNDLNSIANEITPKWTESSSSTYADGYVLASLARFVFYINVLYPELKDEKLYPFPELLSENYKANTCNCNYTGDDFATFSEYADWLSIKVQETLEYFLDNQFWSDDLGMLQPGSCLEINMQVGFARALLFIGLGDNNDDYFKKSKRIAELYKSDVVFNDKCSKLEYSAPVLMLNQQKNSYWWYHMGWKVRNRQCKMRLNEMPDYNYYTAYIEDVNHGAMVALFPLDYYKYASDTIFTEIDMVRFRNTFTKNIYDGERYNIAVDGTNGTTYVDRAYDSLAVAKILKYFSLSYACWGEFDGVDVTANEPNAYDLCRQDYENNFKNLEAVPTYYSGQKCLGHSMLIKQEWKNESPSLRIYNRNMVYNQDFYSPGRLIIAPQEGYYISNVNKTPYAEPKIFVDGEDIQKFVIEPDVEVNLVAKESVIIKRGFRAKSGSKLTIRLKDSD